MIRQKKVMCFPGGVKKAFTVSYDDAVEQDGQLIRLMEQYKIRGTFNISTGWLVEEGTVFAEGEVHRRLTVSQCKKVYDSPVCEVSTHGFSHPFLTTLEPEMIMDQIVSDREMLEQMFGCVVMGHAYHYARTVQSTGKFDLPADWLELNPTCHHDDKNLKNLTEEFLKLAPDVYPQMFYVWGHTFEFERNNNWYVIRELFQNISGKKDIWYATNGEIYDYVKAYKNLEWSVDGTKVINRSAQTLWVEIDGTMRKLEPGFQTI